MWSRRSCRPEIPRRVPHHDGPRRHIPRHDGACAHHASFPERDATPDSRVRANGRTVLDNRWYAFPFAGRGVCPRKAVVGERCGGPNEHAVAQLDAGEHRNVVGDLAVFADDDVPANKHGVSKRCPCADSRPFGHVRVVPNLHVRSKMHVAVDDARYARFHSAREGLLRLRICASTASPLFAQAIICRRRKVAPRHCHHGTSKADNMEPPTETALVTGGAGFIGSHLCDLLLANGARVICVDNLSSGSLNNIRHNLGNPQFQLVRADVRDLDRMRIISTEVTHIYHLAAQIHVERSIVDPDFTYDVNVNGTRNMLQLTREKMGRKMVFASSAEVYGSGVHDEASGLNPMSPYAASKVAAEAMCTAFHHCYGTDVRIVRNFNTFGPRQRGDGYGAVIPIMINRVLANRPPVIYGDGEQTRDYQFITDAAAGYIVSMRAAAGTILNTGSGVDTSIREIAQMIVDKVCALPMCAGMDSKWLAPTHVDPRVGEVRVLRACIDRALELGYTSTVALSEGLDQMVKWYATMQCASVGRMQ